MKRSGYFIVFLLLTACLALFAYHGISGDSQEAWNIPSSAQDSSGDPYQFLSCPAPASVQMFRELDSTDLLLENEEDLEWVSEKLNGVSLSYHADCEAAVSTDDLYMMIDFENGDSWSLILRGTNQLIIGDASVIDGQTAGTPPAGVYGLNGDGLYEDFMNIYESWRYDKTHNALLAA